VQCNTDPCPTSSSGSTSYPTYAPVNCVVSEWGDYGSCSATCGGGVKSRSRNIITLPQNGGNTCPAILSETIPCNADPCPIDCVTGEWSDYGPCSSTCGGGVKTRTRNIITQPQYGGQSCLPISESIPCNTYPCPTSGPTSAPTPAPINCSVSEWGEYGPCSSTCGGGSKTRTRNITTQPQYGGQLCPPLSETAECNTQPCRVDCVVGEWSNLSTCSASCGGGSQTRTRNITTQPQYGGNTCPPLSETKECNTQKCVEWFYYPKGKSTPLNISIPRLLTKLFSVNLPESQVTGGNIRINLSNNFFILINDYDKKVKLVDFNGSIVASTNYMNTISLFSQNRNVDIYISYSNFALTVKIGNITYISFALRNYPPYVSVAIISVQTCIGTTGSINTVGSEYPLKLGIY
jgi:hypothetical protein